MMASELAAKILAAIQRGGDVPVFIYCDWESRVENVELKPAGQNDSLPGQPDLPARIVIS